MGPYATRQKQCVCGAAEANRRLFLEQNAALVGAVPQYGGGYQQQQMTKPRPKLPAHSKGGGHGKSGHQHAHAHGEGAHGHHPVNMHEPKALLDGTV